MIGPAVQGLLFLSVIYWYTKGMLNLINDYYRDEFKAYIDKDTKKSPSSRDTQLPVGNIETCPTMHMEGLPDVLKSSNDLTKSDGIVTRQIDKNSGSKLQCNSQPTITMTKNTIKKDNSDNEKSSDQNQISTIKSASSDDTAELNSAKRQSVATSISSYELGQSNYRQMANQQASDADDDESTKRTSSTRTNGNCFENVDGKSSVAERLTSTSSIPTPPPSPAEPVTKDGAQSFGQTPGIAVNGVVVPADLIRKRIEEKLQKEHCQRKTVNEMVKYWTNYMEAIDVAQSSTSASPSSSAIPRKPSSAANKFDSRTMPRAKSSGEITSSSRNRTADSAKNNS